VSAGAAENDRELLQDKVDSDVQGIGRLYLNAYQQRLQTVGGVVAFSESIAERWWPRPR
jgi:hypothetical protein